MARYCLILLSVVVISVVSFRVSVEKKYVRYKHLTATLTKFKSGAHAGKWRIRYKDRVGKWQIGGVLKDLKKAKERAEELLECVDEQTETARKLSADEIEVIEVMRAKGISKDTLVEWMKQRESSSKMLLNEAVEKYIQTHADRQNYSRAHYNDIVHTLNRIKDELGDSELGLIRIEEVEEFLRDTELSPKRQNNMRGVLSGFWKWASQRGYCERNIITAIAPLKIKKRAGGHEVLTPEEFAVLLVNCPEHFLCWLTISGFAGLRQSEIVGRTGDRESALRWEDFHFDREQPVIVVRPETAKINKPRIVPICDALMQWLKPWRNKTGLVHPHVRPSSGTPPMTATLGELIGGWRDNCLRASRASYRLAETQSLSTVSMEMGHTEGVLKNSYLNPRFEEDAAVWFSLTPRKAAQLVKQRDKKIQKIG